jgi:adenylate cyclase
LSAHTSTVFAGWHVVSRTRSGATSGEGLAFPSLRQAQLVTAVLLIPANLIGSAVVFVLLTRVVPVPELGDVHQWEFENLVLGVGYIPLAVLVGTLRALRMIASGTAWLRERREPSSDEQREVLRLPGRLFWLQTQLWITGAALFGVFNTSRGVPLGLLVALFVGLTGFTVCPITYLFAERTLRPLARRALACRVPHRLRTRSVAFRSMQAWAFGTGISVAGILFAAISSFLIADVTKLRLQVTMIALGATALLAGGLTTWLAAQATADPVRTLRKAIADVGRGELRTQVEIYDGTEIGMLQAGFNAMVTGLREREEIRDLLDRHVGTDVARAALEDGVRLGGEVREVAVLFVDLIGSTTLTTEQPPEAVMRLLNRFFDVVIDVVHTHHGWINKFAGDGALAIWGAPVTVAARNARVLAAARVLGQRLERELPGLRAGVGVSAGRAIAGNVGAAERSEYTVIGDPVNEAARLTEHAKDVPARVLANARLLEDAGEEAARWRLLEPIVVRGRSEPTEIATPT